MEAENNVERTTSYFSWLVVLAGLLVTAVRAGIGMQTLGFIVTPMEAEMGWQSSIITLCITLQLFVAAIIGPKVGKILDNIGAKKILTVGLVANGAMLILVSFVQELWQLAIVMILLGGVTQACIGNTLIMPLITKWFKKQRGFIMGFVSAGANLGSVVIAPLIVKLMGDNADWRYAWFTIGLIPILVIAPIVYVIFHKSENKKPSSIDFPIDQEKNISTVSEPAFTVKEAMKTPVFWKIIIAWNLVDFSMKGVLLNKIPYALEMNYTVTDAAGILSMYSIFAIAGKVLVGFASDRMPLHIIGIVLAIFQAVGLYMFIDAQNVFTLYLAYGILSGLSAGGLIALMPIMLASYYGSKFQGALSGITISLLLFSSVIGPLSASIIRDITGSYRNGFLLYTMLTIMAAFLFVLIRKPKLIRP